MDGENPLPLWLRQALIGIGLFLAGAVLAFGYSYRPLHGALSWRVEQLESRLDERNRENVQLKDAVAKQESSQAKRIDPETLAQVERELDQTKRVLRQAEKDLKRAEKKRKASNASAAKWRTRFEELRDAPVIAVTPSPVAENHDATRTPTFDSAPAAPLGGTDSPSPPGRSQTQEEHGILQPGDPAEPATP